MKRMFREIVASVGTIAAAAVLAITSAAPAGAAPADPAAAAVRALEAHGLLTETPGGADAVGAVSAENGVTAGARTRPCL